MKPSKFIVAGASRARRHRDRRFVPPESGGTDGLTELEEACQPERVEKVGVFGDSGRACDARPARDPAPDAESRAEGSAADLERADLAVELLLRSANSRTCLSASTLPQIVGMPPSSRSS